MTYSFVPLFASTYAFIAVLASVCVCGGTVTCRLLAFMPLPWWVQWATHLVVHLNRVRHLPTLWHSLTQPANLWLLRAWPCQCQFGHPWWPVQRCWQYNPSQRHTTTEVCRRRANAASLRNFRVFHNFSMVTERLPLSQNDLLRGSEMRNDAQDFGGSHEQIGKDLVLSCYLCLFGSSSVPIGVIPQPNHALCKSTATNSKLLRWGCMEICHDNSTNPVSHSKHCHADGFPSTSAWQTGCFTT